ncbi:MAG: hypothetical protein IKF37_01615 [Bacilli bacterium]|nr:hypothetical protein [Bacilli bacterium]
MKKRSKKISINELKKFIKNNSALVIKILLGLLAFMTILLIIINARRLTKLEKLKINEFSNEFVNYIDEVYDGEDKSRYINFAVEYLYNEQNKKAVTEEDVVDVINNIFNKKYTVDKLRKIGITESMANKGITFDISSKEYKYDNVKTKTDIANTVINKFVIDDISKTSKTKFKVKYKRLIVKNPYKVLNYYNDLNIKASINNKKQYDTSGIKEYLEGNSKVKTIKDLINEKNINKIGKVGETITIYFIIENDKLLIDNIK